VVGGIESEKTVGLEMGDVAGKHIHLRSIRGLYPSPHYSNGLETNVSVFISDAHHLVSRST